MDPEKTKLVDRVKPLGASRHVMSRVAMGDVAMVSWVKDRFTWATLW